MEPNGHTSQERGRQRIDLALSQGKKAWLAQIDQRPRRAGLLARWFFRGGIVALGVLAFLAFYRRGMLAPALASALFALLILAVAVAARRLFGG